MSRSVLNWRNAWRIRIVVLGCLVLFLGVGSQVLVNAFASSADMTAVTVTAYTLRGRMADGHYTYLGACAVKTSQFPFGTIIALYNEDGSFSRQCTAEDTGVGYNHIDLAMPGDTKGAIHWGVQHMLAHVVRLGWGQNAPSNPPNTPTKPVSPPIHIKVQKHKLFHS